MAKAASDTKRSGPSPAFKKAREKAEQYQKKYNAKLKEIREGKVPNALLMSTGVLVGAAPTGLVCGLVPEEWKPEGWETAIPTGLITEALATVAGVAVAGASAMAGFEYPIHIGAGMTGSGGSFLIKRGTVYAREMGMKWWEDRQQQTRRAA